MQVLGALLLVSVLAGGQDAAAREPDPLMMALAEAFSAAEKNLARSDRVAFAGSVDTIRELSKGIAGLQARGSTIDGGFLARATSLGDAAREASRRARAGDAAGAAAALEGVRETCVQCHALHRSGNARRGMFPAHGNTVAGEVSLATLGGKEREDRANVVVFLEGVRTPADRPAAPRPRRISQVGAKFEPRVLPIVRGESVEFPNDDFIFHNVFSLSETQPFDLGAYGPGQSKSVAFPRTGLVRIYCNIHPQMLSTILVLENPFFATTDEHGRFAITGVPDGSYVLRCWHEYGGEHRETVELSGGGLVATTFGLQEDKVTLEHRNKFGLPYREAYR